VVPDAIAFAIVALLLFAAPADAAETVIAGGVSSGMPGLTQVSN
jgi:hypothetical protein